MEQGVTRRCRRGGVFRRGAGTKVPPGPAVARGVVLVGAPGGYGKTVLLADWARRTRHPARLLSLDSADNGPARSWRIVMAAPGPGVPGDRRPGRTATRPARAAIVRAAAAAPIASSA